MDLLTGSGSDESDDCTRTVKVQQRGASSTEKESWRRPKKRQREGTVEINWNPRHEEALFVRTTPHIRGNWAGHVFVKVDIEQGGNDCDDEDEEETSKLDAMVRRSLGRLRQSLEDCGWSGTIHPHLNPCDVHKGLHISLSRPFFLQLASIPSFVATLKEKLSLEQSTTLTVLKEEMILTNDEGTRSFWCWSVSSTPTILRILSHVDCVMQQYNQPVYYKPPRLHVSVGSIRGRVPDLSQRDDASTGESNSSDDDDDDDDRFVFVVDCIHCSFGTTKSYVFHLPRG